LPQPVILIVEDDPVSLQILVRQLSQAGFERIHRARSGEEALEAIVARPIDVIVLDVGLPGMNGYEVTSFIRHHHTDPHIPIIMISATGQASERARGLEVGANDFVDKPVDPRELVARVTSQFSYKRMLDELNSERERLQALYRISQALTSHLDFEQTIRDIVSLAPRLVNATKAILILLDEKGGFQQKIVSHQQESAYTVQKIEQAVLETGLAGWVLRTGKIALVADVTEDERWADLPGERGSGSALAVPLAWGDRVVGVLMLESPEPGAFLDEHAGLIEAVGSQAAIALENARLYEQMDQEQKRTNALLTHIGTPVVVTDPDGLIIRTNPAAEEIFGLGIDAIGRSLGDVFGLALADLWQRAQERGGMVSGEHSRRKAGPEESRSFNVSISPIAAVGYMLLWQDISGLKESERVRLDSERAETQRVLSTFSRYMSTALIERVLTDRDILTRRERREAVVLFADLRGFTRLTVEHPPDSVFGLLNDLFSEMLEIINRHEGLVFDITGDELMVTFNVPYSQTDLNHRAITTAVEMQRRFAELQRKWRDRGMEVGMGIGIDRGRVVLGHLGGSSHMNYSMVGEAVNISHRLVEIAGDSQIVVTPEILSDGLPDGVGVTIVEMEPRLLKGKDSPQPIALLGLDGASPAR
jgi:PAS domain S-box-containing protein